MNKLTNLEFTVLISYKRKEIVGLERMPDIKFSYFLSLNVTYQYNLLFPFSNLT